MGKTLLVESFENHQKLIDYILKYKESDGICRVSQAQILQYMNRSLTWLKKAIERINVEEPCLIEYGSDSYVVIHENLIENGVFSIIFKMMGDTLTSPELVRWNDADLMLRYNCKLKTVQMYRAYALSGWKRSLSQTD